MSKRTYILWDSRACGGVGTDDASVIEVCADEQEAREYGGESGGAACYSYADVGANLTDERWEWDWFPKSNKRKKRKGAHQ